MIQLYDDNAFRERTEQSGVKVFVPLTTYEIIRIIRVIRGQ